VNSSAARTAAAVARRSPYQGLVPYTEADADWFFGREEWCEVVTDNLRAYRITVLYGASGVGKSSLLHAGVIRALRDRAPENTAARVASRYLPVAFSAWSLDDPVAALREAVRRAAGEPEGANPSPQETLVDLLETSAAAVGGPLLLVLDQVEELFVYHEQPGDAALRELAAALRRRTRTVHFLLSIREDALAKLDGFEGRVAGLGEHLLRLEPLDRDAAREAILDPLQRWNRTVSARDEDWEIEPRLVEVVLDQRGIAYPGPALTGDDRFGFVGESQGIPTAPQGSYR
jgi:Novel STAND NTPase 1